MSQHVFKKGNSSQTLSNLTSNDTHNIKINIGISTKIIKRKAK